MWSLQTRKSVKTITTGEALEGLQVCTRRAPVAPFSHENKTSSPPAATWGSARTLNA